MLPNVLDFIHFRSIFSFIKKAVIVFFSFAVVLSLFFILFSSDHSGITVTPAQLQAKQQADLYKKINDPILQKTQKTKNMVVAYKKMSCVMIGELCTDNPKEAYRYRKNSLSGMIAGFIVFPYLNPPASATYWAYDTFQNAGFVPKTYASEGIGFASLKPIINLWKVFRDIAYLVLVLVLMAIGFMIMFRMKLNPQTVISVENALPKIVISLILITFSFAIAGFIIDLMYVFIVIIISLLSSGGSSTGAAYNVGDMQNMYLQGNGLQLWDSIFANPANNGGMYFTRMMGIGTSIMFTLFSAVPVWISATVYEVVNFVIGYVITNSLFSLLNSVFGISLNGIIGGFATVDIGPGNLMQLLTVIPIALLSMEIGFSFGPFIIIVALGVLVFFTLLALYFRIFFLLFRAYLQILILIILSPVILLLEAIPGKSTFSFWLKNLLAEVMTFPIVIALMTIGFVLSNQLATNAYKINAAGESTFWRPPFLNIIDPTTLPILVGLGFIMLIPDLVKMAKEQLFGVKGLPVSLGLGTFFAGAGAAGAGGLSLVQQISTMSMGIQALTGRSIGQILKTAKVDPPSGQRSEAPKSGSPVQQEKN